MIKWIWMNHFVARCKSRSFYNRTFSVRLSSCSWMIALAWRDNTLRVHTLKNIKKSVSNKHVGDGFGHFCHQHPLSLYSRVGRKHSKIVINFTMSPTSPSPFYFQQFKVKSIRSYFIKLPVDSYMHRKDHC